MNKLVEQLKVVAELQKMVDADSFYAKDVPQQIKNGYVFCFNCAHFEGQDSITNNEGKRIHRAEFCKLSHTMRYIIVEENKLHSASGLFGPLSIRAYLRKGTMCKDFVWSDWDNE